MLCRVTGLITLCREASTLPASSLQLAEDSESIQALAPSGSGLPTAPSEDSDELMTVAIEAGSNRCGVCQVL